MTLSPPATAAPDLSRLRGFVTGFATILDETNETADILRRGAALLRALVAADDWLPDAFARPDPAQYRQYLLHCDSRERFSVVSFVWGPGQSTPIHDHGVWGLVGVLRGAESVDPLARDADGRIVAAGPRLRLEAGQVDMFGPVIGDLHRVANAHDDRSSVSIHVYGGNIGTVRRATYDAAGTPRPFVSGYANDVLPNLWGQAA